MKDQIHHWKKALDWLKDCNNGTLQHSTKITVSCHFQYTSKEATWKRKDGIVASEYATRYSVSKNVLCHR